LPWQPGLWLDSEDALDLEGRREPGEAAGALKVAVVRFPRISNFTDVDALGLEPDLEVTFCGRPRDLADADLLVLPGTRATIADLAWLRDRGLDRAVLKHAAAGRPVLGVCGGFQMLGSSIADPDGVEGAAGSRVAGLGLLDVDTVFAEDKVLSLATGVGLGERTSGYAIHHGRVTRNDGAEDFVGGARTGAVFGTLWHGCLEADSFRQAFLREVAGAFGRERVPSTVSFAAQRQARLDLLADLVETHLDLDALVDLATQGVPPDLPLLAPGAGA
jgi:adenosylcobyric acid synthase